MGHNDLQELIWAYRSANPTLTWRELIQFIAGRTRVSEAKVEKHLLDKLRLEAGLQVVM